MHIKTGVEAHCSFFEQLNKEMLIRQLTRKQGCGMLNCAAAAELFQQAIAGNP